MGSSFSDTNCSEQVRESMHSIMVFNHTWTATHVKEDPEPQFSSHIYRGLTKGRRGPRGSITDRKQVLMKVRRAHWQHLPGALGFSVRLLGVKVTMVTRLGSQGSDL
jgi:hypothetical protein